MMTTLRVRVALVVVMVSLGLLMTASVFAGPAARGTGNCKLCNCKPWVGGSNNTCGRSTCGHRYYDHY